MSEKISSTLNVQVVGGPRISEMQTFDVDAYDKIEVTIANDGKPDKEVQLQPGGAGQVLFLLIKADKYGDNLTYKVNDKKKDPITLDSMHIFTGVGAVALLDKAPTKLLFSNGLISDKGDKISSTVQIIVGRKAMP